MELDWLFFNPDNGNTGVTQVIGSVTDNTSVGVTKYATVRFANRVGQTQTVKITQETNTEGLVFNVAPYILEFPTTGDTLTGTVVSNSRWFITEYPNWLEISTDNPNSYGSGVITVVASPNTGTTERSGNIIITSYGEEKMIFVYQPAYTTLSVSPTKLMFRGTTGSSSVTITSSARWSAIEYDTEHIELSADVGESGTTSITVTLKNLPSYVEKYGVGFQRDIVFTDGLTERVVAVQYVGAQNIDDKYITVTYNIPTPGTYLAYKYVRCSGCSNWAAIVDDQTIWAKTEVHSEELVPDDWEGWPCYELVYVFYYFGTAGLHTIKYFSDYYGIGMAAFHKVGNIVSIVIGDKNNGTINPWAIAQTRANLVFGAGTHSFVNSSSNPNVFSRVNFGTSLYIPPTLLNGGNGIYAGGCSVNTVVYDHTGQSVGSAIRVSPGVSAQTIVFTERVDSARTIYGSLSYSRLKNIVFISETAPLLGTNINHKVTVYYPRNGTGYTTRWSDGNVTLVPYDDIDDVPV